MKNDWFWQFIEDLYKHLTNPCLSTIDCCVYVLSVACARAIIESYGSGLLDGKVLLEILIFSFGAGWLGDKLTKKQ